jgi:hypothetical protein
MAQCGRNNENDNKNNTSLLEQFANNNNANANANANATNNAECPYPTEPEGFTEYVLDFGKKLLVNIGLFGIIFLILFIRQNYFDPKSFPSILAFIGITSVLFCIIQYLYPDINGFIVAGIGVSVGMAMFKDQFSTIFINNSSARLN